MDLNAFWALVERPRVETSGQDERLERLTAALSGADAADVICAGLCSDDGFFYFQAWLIGLGWETFDGDLEPAPAPRGVRVLVSPEPAGEQWDFADPAEISARIPRLGALFGKVA